MVGLVAAVFPFPPLGILSRNSMLRLVSVSSWPGCLSTRKFKPGIKGTQGRKTQSVRVAFKPPNFNPDTPPKPLPIVNAAALDNSISNSSPTPPALFCRRRHAKAFPPITAKLHKLTSKRTQEWRTTARAEPFILGRRPTRPNVLVKRPRHETLCARRELIGQPERLFAS